MNTRLLLPIILASVLLSLLSGCRILKPKDDPTKYFVLTANSQKKLTSNSGLRVLIGPVTIPGYLDHTEIMTAMPGHGLNRAEFFVWAESIDDAIGRVVSDNVSALLDSPSVGPFPDADFDFDYKVSIIVRRFERDPGGVVRLATSYVVSRPAGTDKMTSDGNRDVSVTVSNPEDFGSIAEAMSRALEDLSETLAREVLAFHRKVTAAEQKKADEESESPEVTE